MTWVQVRVTFQRQQTTQLFGLVSHNLFQDQLDDETLFPSKIGVPFPPNFQVHRTVIPAMVQRLSHRFGFQNSPAVPAVKTPVGAVAKTHRFVWRPQEVVSRAASHLCRGFVFVSEGGTMRF